MKKLIYTIIAVGLFTVSAWSQCSITGLPSTICEDGTVQTVTVEGGTLGGPGIVGNEFDPAIAGPGSHIIYILGSGGGTSQIYAVNQNGAFNPETTTGTQVTLGDDQVSTALPLGFTFNFFGVDYQDFYISSNGFITFSAAQGSGCCSGGTIPSDDAVNNVIAFSWDDMYPPGGNSLIDYTTIGTAPNRRLVMNFNDVAFCCASTPSVKTQVILYETSNIIEIHTEYANGVNPGTMGIENADGTIGYTVEGRNSEIWVDLTNDFVSFAPACASVLVEVTDGSFANLGDDLTICAGDSIYVTPGLDNDAYTWNDASTNDSLLISGAGQYFVEVTDAGGCVDSDTMNVVAAAISEMTEDLCIRVDEPLVVLSALPSTNPLPTLNDVGVWSGVGLTTVSQTDTVLVFDAGGGDSLTFGADLCNEGLSSQGLYTSPLFSINTPIAPDSIRFHVYHTSCDATYTWSVKVNGVEIEQIPGMFPNTCDCIPSDPLELVTSASGDIALNWNTNGTNTVAIEYISDNPDNTAGIFAEIFTTSALFDAAAAGVGLHYMNYSVCSLSDSVLIAILDDEINLTATDSVFLCNNNEVVLASEIPNNVGTPVWSLADTLWSTDSIVVTIPGMYTLNNASCNYIDSIEVLVSPDVSYEIVATQVSCNGLNDGSLAVLGNSGTAPYYYDFGDGFSTNGFIDSLFAGELTVLLTDTRGCSETIVTSVEEPSVLDGSAIIMDETLGADGSIDLTVSGGTADYTFIWSNGETSEDLNGLSAGEYTVEITDDLGCSTSATFTVNSQVGLNEFDSNFNFAIYPNPSEGLLNLKITSSISGNDVSINILNAVGQLVNTKNMNVLSGENNTEIDLNGYEKGVYFIKVTFEEKVYVARVSLI